MFWGSLFSKKNLLTCLVVLRCFAGTEENKKTIRDDGVDEQNHGACQDFVAEKQWNGQIMKKQIMMNHVYIYICMYVYIVKLWARSFHQQTIYMVR